MTRSRASAKAAGSSFERLIADRLATHVDDRIDRRVKTGAADKEDLDPATQTDYHVPPMLYTGPLTVTPTGKFRIRPEDVVYHKGVG